MSVHELPSQTILQQHSARPVSGEELEAYGKYASALYHDGKCTSLNDAVVETIKHAGLSPEQVRRVIEFTNTQAFLSEFKKEGMQHHYVHFDKGLADPSEILKDLNDGGGGTVFDRGTADYKQPPEEIKQAFVELRRNNSTSLEKVAGVSRESNPMDALLEEGFKTEGKDIPYADPLSDVTDAHQKLSAACDSLTLEMSGLEAELLELREDLYNQVKQAVATDVPLGHVIQAWHAATDADPLLVKAAFKDIGPRLVEEEVIPTYPMLAESIEKTAGAVLVNEKHPLVGCFSALCDTVEKLAHARAAREEVLLNVQKLDAFITMAEKALEEV